MISALDLPNKIWTDKFLGMPKYFKYEPKRFMTITSLTFTIIFLVAIVVYCMNDQFNNDVASAQERGMAAGLPFMDPIDLNTDTPSHLKISLTARDSDFSISGKRISGTGYNGQFIGPTIRLIPGEQVDLHFLNRSRSLSNLHFHGLHIATSGPADNPGISVPAKQSFTYHLNIPKDHPIGTSWYHDHDMCADMSNSNMGNMKISSMKMGRTVTGDVTGGRQCTDIESQIFAGLSGTIIVGDIRQLLPAEFRHIKEHTIVLKDIQLNKDDGIIQNSVTEKIDANNPAVRLVNGQLRPILEMKPGETQLWRLANEGADIFYHLQLQGYSFTVVGEDGFPVSKVTTAQKLLLPPGKRYDVLVTAKPGNGSAWLKTLKYRQGEDTYPQVNLMSLHVGNPLTKAVLATKFSIANFSVSPSKENLAIEAIAQQRVVTLGASVDGATMFINGNRFDKEKPAFATPAKVGTVEEWTIVNRTTEIHPFHTHTDYFQVISINGVKQPFTGLQSDIPVPKQVNGVPGKVVIRIDFADFTGQMMFHCHIAAHEHAGMMSFIDVIE